MSETLAQFCGIPKESGNSKKFGNEQILSKVTVKMMKLPPNSRQFQIGFYFTLLFPFSPGDLKKEQTEVYREARKIQIP